MVKTKKSIFSIGFLDILGLIFITLKLTHFIDWSWWLVLLPVYGPLVLVVGIILIILILVLIIGGIAALFNR